MIIEISTNGEVWIDGETVKGVKAEKLLMEYLKHGKLSPQIINKHLHYKRRTKGKAA